MPGEVLFFYIINMEIFRTDGGGRTENDPRLLQVIGNVMKHIPNTSNLWKNVVSVEDQKGDLIIVLREQFINTLDETFLYFHFMKAWDEVGEDHDNVEIYYERFKK